MAVSRQVDSDTEWETEGDTELGDVSDIGSVRGQVESRTDSMIDEYPDISGNEGYFSYSYR